MAPLKLEPSWRTQPRVRVLASRWGFLEARGVVTARGWAGSRWQPGLMGRSGPETPGKRDLLPMDLPFHALK